MQEGLLIINLGTPSHPDRKAVRAYLSEFLTDKRVIDLPALIRYVLVYGFILPFRTKQSTHAYQSIWSEQGSPLLCHSQNLASQLQARLSPEFKIALGMRYGKPSIKTALDELKDCASITVLPLYPQYSSAATGSSIEEVIRLLSMQEVIPSLNIIRDFYQHPGYIKAQAALIKENLGEDQHLIFSYHGLPERQINKSGCHTVCKESCPPVSVTNQGCYKAQCYETSRQLADELQLHTGQYSTSFQSRLGKTPWIKPYTDEVLTELAAQGIKNLAICCPSFVADCLETLEEIGLRAKEQWIESGGKEFNLIPCLNDSPAWIEAIIDIKK
ncbi:ferrochelatase [Legionella shakespearei]|uniref:Ferrochelatase n=1 Tax=Legionella shakespearei DSM 23087 TaxID=1122169 RepID=A0A0W0Z9S5_9GAMM|nr:ferrochelatase [Legionella shakespearei]KTD65861.1 ferrochelatase [Legionella shakespearei DSM 23087]